MGARRRGTPPRARWPIRNKFPISRASRTAASTLRDRHIFPLPTRSSSLSRTFVGPSKRRRGRWRKGRRRDRNAFLSRREDAKSCRRDAIFTRSRAEIRKNGAGNGRIKSWIKTRLCARQEASLVPPPPPRGASAPELPTRAIRGFARGERVAPRK